MYDLKIIEATFFDYDLNKKLKKDILINNGKIINIGINLPDAEKIINADGRVVSPGFIDIHMHEEKLDLDKENPYDISDKMLLMGVTTAVAGNCGNNRQSLETFFGYIDENNAPINYLSYIGHNYLRKIVGINDKYREATDSEIEKMKDLIKKNIEENGAIGISFGIEYSPGISYMELLKLAKTYYDGDILLSAHYRKDANAGVDSIKELIDLSKDSKLPMQISHIGSCAAFGMMKEALSKIKKARENKIDVTADCYPYEAFSTSIGSTVFDEGCFEQWGSSFDSILLTEKPYKNVVCDKETFYEIREKYPDMLVVANVLNKTEVIEAIKEPYVFIGSDGLYNNSQGHPRGAGTFPKVLGYFVRNRRELTLEDALMKMTVLPAKRIGLFNKGEIKIGFDADLVIFDENKINAKSTYKKPTEPPEGINYVIIDGKIAVNNGRMINNRLGKVIRTNELKRAQI